VFVQQQIEQTSRWPKSASELEWGERQEEGLAEIRFGT
jgi:hypothetical protein